MNKIKNILASLALLSSATLSYGAQATLTTVTAGVNANMGSNIVAGQLYISEITIANSAASALQVALFDAPGTNLTFTVGPFTNFYTTNGTVLTVSTNFFGNTQTNTNTMVYTVAQSVTGMVYSYRPIASISVGASATVTYRPVDGLMTSFGVSCTNNTSCVYTITYSTIR